METPRLNEQLFSQAEMFVLKDPNPSAEKVPYTIKGAIPYYQPRDGGRFPAGVLIGEIASTAAVTGTDGRRYLEVQCEGWDFRNHLFWSEWVRTFPHGYIALADEPVYWKRQSYIGKTQEQLQDEQTIRDIYGEFDSYLGVLPPDRIYKDTRADGTLAWKVAWSNGYSAWWDIFQAISLASKVTYTNERKWNESDALKKLANAGSEEDSNADNRGVKLGNETNLNLSNYLFYSLGILSLLVIIWASFRKQRHVR